MKVGGSKAKCSISTIVSCTTPNRMFPAFVYIIIPPLSNFIVFS